MRLLILTEAGENIGLGHYTRCSAVYKTALLRGIDARMLVSFNGRATFNDSNIEIVDWRNDPAAISRFGKDLTILVDSYLLTAEGYDILKKYGRLAVIDDYNRLVYPADILINPNVYFDPAEYISQPAICYGGKEYVILRDAFTNGIDANTADKSGCLITTGGTDIHGILPLLCRTVLDNFEIPVSIVCPDEELRKSIKAQFTGVTCYGNLDAAEMASVYLKAEVVLAGCGQSLHELAKLGKPTVGILLGDDQLKNQAFYFQHEFIPAIINWSDTDLGEKVVKAVKELLSEPGIKRSRESGPKLVTGSGAANIVSLLVDNITYRPANEKDSLVFFNWANDPQVRKNAFHNEPIEWDTHNNWFNNKIKSDSLLVIFYCDDKPAGQVRIDWENNIGVIDFSVDPSFRNRGFGRKFLQIMIKIAQQSYPGSEIEGIVKEENIPSAKAFRAAGFTQKDNRLINGVNCQIFSYQYNTNGSVQG